MGGSGGNTFLLVSLEVSGWTAEPITAEELARRLIILIYAGWYRRNMIRRELPRTDNAGWVVRPYRTIFHEGSPLRGPSAVIGTAVQQGCMKVYAALDFNCASARTAMAHRNPRSSRASAVITWFLCFPRAVSVV
jgi:hypothetical protein